MFAAALIVFREVLEASLIVTIIMAATLGVRHRGYWVALGVAGGILGAGFVAACTSSLATLFDGAGQDIVNACILFLAVGLIGWHTVWMNGQGRQIAAQMRGVGQSVSGGEKHMSVLAIVIGLAVMREGSEVVLLLQGLWTGEGGASTMIGGALLGFAAGAGSAALMYLGFLAMPLQRVFALTNGILVLIAAGMAARGANFLAQAGLVPSFGSSLWDSSSFISERSPVGQILAALVGYIARPSGIEVAFYVGTVLLVLALMRFARRTLTVVRG